MLVTVTLNTSIDKRYEVKQAVKGGVNRVDKCTFSAGGKGLNVARVAAIAGEEVMAFGFSGGHNGRLLEELAKKDGIQTEFVRVQGETRSCINIYDRSIAEQTEFLEPGAMISEEENDRLEQKFEAILKTADIVTISGSIPLGVDAACYQRFIEKAKAAKVPVLLDSSGELLKESIKACPDLIKPNQDEIEQLIGHPVKDKNELCQFGNTLQEMGIKRVVISLGKEGSLMFTKNGIMQAEMPQITAVNTVGCGDAMLAGLAIGIYHSWEDQEILKYASALAAANALREETGYFRKEDFETIYQQIKIIRR